MKKEFLKKQKEKLKKEKEKLEKDLKKIASENEKVDHDWIARYPQFSEGDLEEEADEVEEYGNRLPVSYALELELKKVNQALGRIKNETYGKCKKCGEKITKDRLKVYPQAETCKKCLN